MKKKVLEYATVENHVYICLNCNTADIVDFIPRASENLMSWIHEYPIGYSVKDVGLIYWVGLF